MTTTALAVDPAVVTMMDDVFAVHADRNGHLDASVAALWDGILWARLQELGLTRLTGSEASGGSGAGWPEAAELIRSAAWHGIALPYPEHDLLAGWLLETAGLPVDDRLRTACLLDADGCAKYVPWASVAERIVVLSAVGTGYLITDVDIADVLVTPGTNIAGEPRDAVRVDLTHIIGPAVDPDIVEVFGRRCALIRAIQIGAALNRIVDMCVDYTASRSQFGRALARFQAVQTHLADMAAEAGLANAGIEAALLAAITTDWRGPALDFQIAAARSCAGHAGTTVIRSAHQVHGAVGTTFEYPLHRYTQPALAWRSEYGSTRYWDDRLTNIAIQAGPRLWSLISE